MKVYFITRFSIFDPEFGGFRLTKDYDRTEYERRLFNEDRLDHKFGDFENITFPSIVVQSCSDWMWQIYTSNRLPHKYMQRLSDLVKQYKTISLYKVKDFGEFFAKGSSYNYGNSFATVRIDDDDGLNMSFVEKLQQYSGNVGSIVSFTEGALVKRVNGTIVVGKRVSYKNCALGLSGIGLNIYGCGRHSDIDTRYHVIYDSTPDMFLLDCSPHADTKRGFTALDRLRVKLTRLCFLIAYQPRKLPRECYAFVQKRAQFLSRKLLGYRNRAV
jgi:hypothetical protein